MRHPVEDWPLAVCDGSNVDYADLIEVDHIRRQYIGGTMNAMYKDKYRWYYLHKQTSNEVLLLKQFDSSDSVKAKCESIFNDGRHRQISDEELVTPHASFHNQHAHPDAPRRESIEVRALVFTYHQ